MLPFYKTKRSMSMHMSFSLMFSHDFLIRLIRTKYVVDLQSSWPQERTCFIRGGVSASPFLLGERLAYFGDFPGAGKV